MLQPAHKVKWDNTSEFYLMHSTENDCTMTSGGQSQPGLYRNFAKGREGGGGGGGGGGLGMGKKVGGGGGQKLNSIRGGGKGRECFPLHSTHP